MWCLLITQPFLTQLWTTNGFKQLSTEHSFCSVGLSVVAVFHERLVQCGSQALSVYALSVLNSPFLKKDKFWTDQTFGLSSVIFSRGKAINEGGRAFQTRAFWFLRSEITRSDWVRQHSLGTVEACTAPTSDVGRDSGITDALFWCV